MVYLTGVRSVSRCMCSAVDYVCPGKFQLVGRYVWDQRSELKVIEINCDENQLPMKLRSLVSDFHSESEDS